MSKVAIVTGASRGIGRAVAIRLAAEGWNLALQSTEASKDMLSELAEELSGTVKVEAFYCDFSKCSSSAGENLVIFLDAVIASFGRVDALVNNAGVLSDVSVMDVDVDELQRVFEVNTFAPVVTLKRCF